MIIADKTSLVVLQPTPFCNIDCRYCYLPNRRDRRSMAPDKVGVLFARLLEFPTVRDDMTLVWHAGEPLVLGPRYYEETFENIRRTAGDQIAVHHAFQTNGMLISDRWSDLFRKWDVIVGVSVDGPKPIHDASRVTRRGAGTFDQTLMGIACLQGNKIPYHVISVLTHAALGQVDEKFAFYRDNNILNVGFNFEEREGVNQRTAFDIDFDDRSIIRFSLDWSS
jgi:uncharacterized protein